MIYDINAFDVNFLRDCIDNLDGKPFQNEAQFQFALATKIKENSENLFVDIELSANQNGINKSLNRKNIDIVVSNNKEEFIAIELKYKTRDKRTNYTEFYYDDANNQKVRIACQGASNLAKYSFIYDIYRLELLKKCQITIYPNHRKYSKFTKGFAILVTNDIGNIVNKHYDSKSTCLYNSSCVGNGDYIQEKIFYPLNNKNKSQFISLAANTNANKKGKSRYLCDWSKTPFYKDKINTTLPEFQYLIIEIN